MAIDYSRFLGHGWQVFSRNRVLWLLGFVMALATTALAPFALLGNLIPLTVMRDARSTTGTVPDFPTLWAQWGGVLIGGVLLMGVVGLVAGFISAGGEAALIHTIDQIERTQQAPRLGAAWRQGTRRMGSLWLLTLLVGLVTTGLIGVTLIPVLIGVSGLIQQIIANPDNPRVISNFSVSMGCTAVLFLPVLVVSAVLNMVRQFAAQAVVLDNAGVLAALGTGWRMLRQNIAPVLVILFATYVAGYVAGFIIAPASLVFLLPVMALGMSQAAGGGGSVLLPLLLVVGGVLYWVCLAAVSGLLSAFTTVLWTLLYRHRRALPNSDLAPVALTPYGGVPYNLVPTGAAPPPPYPLTPPGPPRAGG